MADNTKLPGTGEIYASDERAGVNFQKVLIDTLDSPSVDAFSRWRVSNPHTVFDSKLLHGDSQDLFWDEELESGTMATAGPTAAKPFIDFTSSNTTAGQRTRQTFQRFNYQPGKSQLIVMTAVLELASGVKTGCKRRIGLFDDNNGIFFESNAGVISVIVRTNDTGSPVDTTTVQSSWNLDVMDGNELVNNPSGITLDITKSQIFLFDFQWLSAGRIRFGFEINGAIVYVHEYFVSNILNIPWASTPNLPLRYQIITTTDSGVCSMRCICAVVISEGGVDRLGLVLYKSTEGAAVTTDAENLLFAIVGLRLKATHLGATIDITHASIHIETASENLEWVLVHGDKNTPITVAGTFTYGDVSNGAVQAALGATENRVTGGTIITGGYLDSGSGGGGAGSLEYEIHSTLNLGAAIDGTRSEVILCIRPIGGKSIMDVEGSISWREIA